MFFLLHVISLSLRQGQEAPWWTAASPQRGCCSPGLSVGLSWWPRWEGFSPLFPTGSVFYDASQYGSHHLPRGQWQFLFPGEQWMMVASTKGNNSAWGEKQQQQQPNNFLLQKTTASMAIHMKPLGGKHLLCQPVFTGKLRGRWEAPCLSAAPKGKPGALSLEEWWRGKWTCAFSAQDKKVAEQGGFAVSPNKSGALGSWSLHQN